MIPLIEALRLLNDGCPGNNDFWLCRYRKMKAVQIVVCAGKGGFFIWPTAKAGNLKKH